MGLQNRRNEAVRPATLGPWAVGAIPSLRAVGAAFRWGAVVIVAFVGLELILSSSIPLLGWTFIATAAAIAARQRQSRLRSTQENWRGDRSRNPHR